MVEIIWHGRGGQGAFTAARLLGAAATLADERFALAFPSFGPERRGAPMRAFTKISSEPIGDRSAVRKADFVVYLDGTLLDASWRDELKEGGICFANAPSALDEAGLVRINADLIASEVLGRPIPNTVFLGALAAAGCIEQAAIEQAIREYMPQKLHERNLAVVKRAANEAAALIEAASAPGAAASVAAEPGAKASTPAAEAAAASAEVAAAAPAGETQPKAAHERSDHARPSHICTLRDEVPAVAQYADSTCFEAGYLTQVNAGWRNIRPVFNPSLCTGCLQCYMDCPDGALFKVPAANRAGAGVGIDLDFCKGCGICATACRSGAIMMVSEEAAMATGTAHARKAADSHESAPAAPATAGAAHASTDAAPASASSGPAPASTSATIEPTATNNSTKEGSRR